MDALQFPASILRRSLRFVIDQPNALFAFSVLVNRNPARSIRRRNKANAAFVNVACFYPYRYLSDICLEHAVRSLRSRAPQAMERTRSLLSPSQQTSAAINFPANFGQLVSFSCIRGNNGFLRRKVDQ